MSETKRVIYYDQLDNNRPTSGDVIFVDNPTTGTHKMDLKSFVDMINNGFDSSIKSSGVSVSADNYSSIITNVNDQPVNSIYTYGAGLQSHVSNLPSNKAMTIVNLAQKSTGGLGQVMLAIERNGSGDYLYFRTIGGSPAAWSSWVKVANNSDVEAVREALDNLDVETDKSLSIDGKPADAKAAGDEINSLKADLTLCADWSEQPNDWIKGTSAGHRYYIYLGQSNDKYKVTIASGLWFAVQGYTTSDYSGSYSYVSDKYTSEAVFTLDSATTGYYYRLCLGQNTSSDIPAADRANSKIYIMKNVLADSIAELDDSIDSLSDTTDNTFAQIADISVSTLLDEETITITGVGNKRVNITGLQSGDRIRVQMSVDNTVSYKWDILTSATSGGATIRTIAGSTGDENGNVTGSNDVTVILQGSETCLAVRGINYSSGTKNFSVTVTKLPTVPTHIKASALVNTYKRIVWFGTSIPEGNLGTLSYPLVLGQKLGVTVFNEAVGSSRARASWVEFVTQSNPIGAGSGYNSLRKAMGYTLSEKQYLIDNYDTLKDQFTDTHPETLSDADKLAIKNYSFERKLYRYLDAKKTTYETVNSDGFIGDVDVYVLDHGYNDVTTRYASDTTIPEFGAEHEMYYFAGAMNRYIKDIMENNLYAKIVIVAHYANTEGLKDAVAVEMQNKIAAYWNIPIIRVYEKTGWTDVEITINGTTKTVRQAWLPDGVHPASDSTGKAVERYVDILYPFFRDLIANA